MGKQSGIGQKNGLRVMAIGLTILAIAAVWSGLMLDQRRGLFITLLCVSLALVLFGAVASLAARPAGDATPARSVLQAALPVVAVAVAAILATALYWVSAVRAGVQVVDDPPIDWTAASETNPRIP